MRYQFCCNLFSVPTMATKKKRAQQPLVKSSVPCLYRRDGVFYSLIKVSGKAHRKSLRTTDFELAKQRLKAERRRLENTDTRLAGRTIAAHGAIFGPLMSGAETTLKNKRMALRRLVEDWPVSAPNVLSKIKPSHVLLWLQPYAAKPSSFNLHKQVAADFFLLAVQDKIIEVSPTADIKYAKRKEVLRSTPTLEEFDAIVADVRGQVKGGLAEDSADFIALAGTLGLGQAELRNIRRQDISLEDSEIKVCRQKTSKRFTIPIFPEARPILERRLAAMAKSPDAPLLPTQNFKGAIENSCRRLGLPKYTPRSLRRLHITRAIRKNIDVGTIALWQGHNDGGSLILKTYQAEVNQAHSQAKAAMMTGR